MKKILIIAAVAVLAIGSLCAFTTPSNGEGRLTPAEFCEHLFTSFVKDAQESGAITADEAKQLNEYASTGIIGRCVEALFCNNYKPSAAVNEAAKVAVENGYYPNEAAAKKGFRASCEALRKDKSFAERVYKTLGI